MSPNWRCSSSGTSDTPAERVRGGAGLGKAGQGARAGEVGQQAPRVSHSLCTIAGSWPWRCRAPAGPELQAAFFPLPLEGSSGLTGGFLMFLDGCIDGITRTTRRPTHLGGHRPPAGRRNAVGQQLALCIPDVAAHGLATSQPASDPITCTYNSALACWSPCKHGLCGAPGENGGHKAQCTW